MQIHSVAYVLLLLPLLATIGCAMQQVPCKTGYAMSVYPAVATTDSAGKTPVNQQRFQASVGVVVLQQGSGICPVPLVLVLAHPAWTSPDPAHLTISSADDPTNGTAVCNGPTSGPVTLTATLPAGSLGGSITTPLTATAQLTCK